MSILATVVALSVLILIHEFGHLFAAKSVGIAAPRFSLGLGPRVAGFHWGETEFVISAIPLGGYVKMAGMEDDEAMEVLEGGEQAPPVDPSRTFDAKPLWARAWVISAGVIMNLLFALLANIVLAFAQGEPYISETRLAPITTLGGSTAQVAQVPLGARVVSVGGRPVANYNEIQDALLAAPAGPVALGLEGRPVVTLQLPAPGGSRDSVVGALQPLSAPVLGQLNPDQPAADAGLRAGDSIVSIDRQPIRTWPEAVERVRASPGKPLAVVVERNGTRREVTLTPRAEKEQDKTVGKIGAAGLPQTAYRTLGFGEALSYGTAETGRMIKTLMVTLRDLFTGALSPRNLGGLLAIGEASGESAQQGPATFLWFLAFLSVNLAVLNLLPIPILDGGHLMFLAIEAVRGRPLSVESRIRLSHVGLIIVVGLMLWANGNDVVRLFQRYFGG
ncbi:RIP metalloprotease RseP [Longimicrobium sp.]|uniref:RIP metalloprotease RseP n=1 Tax=Longimicrobium sp. TaxID=2029185 RepID=UPI002E36B598|nr:RIP metalloprotease RseP [Longimicrobium sp.]HEX6040376.1 RIP metalloprotease RseP [Longimicrobium sp.]